MDWQLSPPNTGNFTAEMATNTLSVSFSARKTELQKQGDFYPHQCERRCYSHALNTLTHHQSCQVQINSFSNY